MAHPSLDDVERHGAASRGARGVVDPLVGSLAEVRSRAHARDAPAGGREKPPIRRMNALVSRAGRTTSGTAVHGWSTSCRGRGRPAPSDRIRHQAVETIPDPLQVGAHFRREDHCHSVRAHLRRQAIHRCWPHQDHPRSASAQRAHAALRWTADFGAGRPGGDDGLRLWRSVRASGRSGCAERPCGLGFPVGGAVRVAVAVRADLSHGSCRARPAGPCR
jgi:hypothetical protein